MHAIQLNEHTIFDIADAAGISADELRQAMTERTQKHNFKGPRYFIPDFVRKDGKPYGSWVIITETSLNENYVRDNVPPNNWFYLRHKA